MSETPATTHQMQCLPIHNFLEEETDTLRELTEP
ncbi:hypothetical protein Nos7107_3385 [Nostoc sp. PCC 7107]|nr:hypothetical protein Nos7107_3385 [Nostoc sp. PCC 7107]